MTHDSCVAPTPEVLGCRGSEAGVYSLSAGVVEGRVHGVVEARGLRPIDSPAKKSVAHASSAFSAVDFGNAFSSAPSGACVRDLFSPPLAAPAALAAAVANIALAVFSCALETASWHDFCLTAAGAGGHGPIPPLFLHCSASPERWLQFHVRKDPDKVAVDALPRIPWFGGPAFLHNVTRSRLKITPEARPPFSVRHGKCAH